MRFKEFILEDSEFSAELILRDCSKWIEATKLSSAKAWHGTGGSGGAEVKLIKNRYRESPSNSSKTLHDAANRILKDKFGWQPRMEGLFVSGDVDMAQSYGYEHLVFPKGDFKFVWSPEIQDLYFYSKGFYKRHRIAGTTAATTILIDELENNIEWKDDDIVAALESGNEVIIKAAAFYLVDARSNFYQKELMPLLRGAK